MKLIFDLQFNEILVVTTQKLCSRKLAHSRKKSPVADHLILAYGEFVVAFGWNDRRKITLPTLDLVREHPLLLKLKYAKYDLSYRKIVRRLDFRDLLTAKVHHFCEKRYEILSVTVTDENADVYCQARKTVLGESFSLDSVEIFVNMLVRISRKSLCH